MSRFKPNRRTQFLFVFWRRLIKFRRVNETDPGFAAYAPAADGKAVNGKIFVLWQKIRFESGEDEMPIEIPMERLAVEFGGEDGERVCFSDLAQPDVQFFTFDEAILEHRAFKYSKHVQKQLAAIEQQGELWRRLRLTLYFFLACGLVAWLGSLAGGLAVRSLVREIPVAWENKFGDAAFAKLQEQMVFVDDSNAVAQLTALAQPLVRTVPANGIRFQFHIFADPLPNAFALPGGHISVSTGLLQITDNPDELLGVIAHEMAHVTQRHVFRRLISGKGPFFILHVFAGGRSQLLDALAYPSEELVYESFSQEYERQADSIGWSYLVAAHVNPHGMIDLFHKLAHYDSAHGLASQATAFSSHPALEQRIGWLDAKWNKLPDKTNFITLANPVPKIPEGDLEKATEKMERQLREMKRN
jgi:Zn-dependent protease with chaperone function